MSIARSWHAAFFGLAILFSASGTRAQTVAVNGLKYNYRIDFPVAATAAGLLVIDESLTGRLAFESLAPTRCRACDRNSDGSDALNAPDAAVRRALRWNDTDAASVASDLTAFSITPIASLGMCEVAAAAANRAHEAPPNALVVLEAGAIAADVDQVLKLVVARQRPFAHFRDPAAPHPRNPDENLSFYSGHTSLAFSLAVASGTVASMRSYKLAPAVWASSLPIATLTGYLRIAADKHYFTDVLTGAIVGSAIGFVVPFVFHRAPAPSVDPSNPGAMPGLAMRGPGAVGAWTF